MGNSEPDCAGLVDEVEGKGQGGPVTPLGTRLVRGSLACEAASLGLSCSLIFIKEAMGFP